MKPAIKNLESVKYPVVVVDQREIGFDPDLSFPFNSESEMDEGDLGYPSADYCEPRGWTKISFTAADETEFVNRVTEYLVTCYDCSDVTVKPFVSSVGQLSFSIQMPEEALLLI